METVCKITKGIGASTRKVMGPEGQGPVGKEGLEHETDGFGERDNR